MTHNSDSVELNTLATALSCHPRTILRLMTDEPNPYWSSKHNPMISIIDFSEKTGAVLSDMQAAMKYDIPLLKPKEMAEVLEVKYRTFRARDYTATIRKAGTVRYFQRSTVNEHFRKFSKS